MYQEWITLIEDSKAGDLKAKEEVLNRLLPLIIKSIQSYYNRRQFFEELIQEGNLCILEAIESYDPGKGVYFLGHAKTQLKYLYLKKNKEKIHLSLNTKIGDEKEEFLNTLESQDPQALDTMIKKEEIKALKASLVYLTDRQKQVTILFYLKRKSITQIAQELGISYRTVVNTKTRALEKLKEQLS